MYIIVWKYELKNAEGCVWLGAKQVCYRDKDGKVLKRAVRGLRRGARNEEVVSWQNFVDVLQDRYFNDDGDGSTLENVYSAYARGVFDLAEGRRQSDARRSHQPIGFNSTIMERYNHLVTVTLRRNAMNAVFFKRRICSTGVFTFPMFID